jgi:hypothetical protein
MKNKQKISKKKNLKSHYLGKKPIFKLIIVRLKFAIGL